MGELTTKEIIEELRKGMPTFDSSDEECERYEKAYNMAIEMLESQKIGLWIPVSERLPEFGQDILLSLRSLDITTGFRAKTEPYFYCHGVDGCYIEPQNVLAWMPLPQPYNAESEE